MILVDIRPACPKCQTTENNWNGERDGWVYRKCRHVNADGTQCGHRFKVLLVSAAEVLSIEYRAH